MAKVFIEETTLTAIGDAIRGKEGTTELVPVNDMATRITDLPSGGNEPTDEELTITGKCNYRFTTGGWDWFINKYSNRITTKDITNCSNLLDGTTLSEIPFTINLSDCGDLMNVIQHSSLSVCPKLRGTIKWTTSTKVSNIFVNCHYLRYVDDLFTPEMIEGFSTVKPTSTYGFPSPDNMHNLNSLRSMPEWWYKFRLNPESTIYPNYSYCLYYQLGYQCASLDEMTNIPVWKCQAAQTSNMFYNLCRNAMRIKTITFETNPDGTPIETQWKSQTIDLSVETGYCSTYGYSGIIGYNSGITVDKLVISDAKYQELKDDPDWYTNMPEYSRYNKLSAIETINSLPDTSAYLATAGGTNTIKFRGAAGSKTDGGAINTMTAEEIAIATARGWTVTFA